MATVPSIRLIVPTPDASAYTDPNASTSISISPGRATSGLGKKKSALGLGRFAGQSATPYNTARGADFSDIVRRVVGGEGQGSVTGRGWEVRVDAGSSITEGSVRSTLSSRREPGTGTWGRDAGVLDENDYEAGGGGEGMVLIKKKVKSRGRVDGVFALSDVTNARPTSPALAPTGRSTTPIGIDATKDGKEAKEKWWNLTARGRKDTGSSVLKGLVRRGKSPGPSSLPPTPTELAPSQFQARGHLPQEHQIHLSGEPDCTLDMVDVPSVRGRGVLQGEYLISYLPPSQQPFPAHGQKRFNSLGASSALAPSAPAPRAEYQRSVSAGSAALLSQSQRPGLAQSQQRGQLDSSAPHRPSLDKYAHLPGASAPYATMTRAATYQQPASPRSVPPKSPTQQGFQPAFVQQQTQRQRQEGSKETRAPPFQRSASAMAFYSPSEPASSSAQSSSKSKHPPPPTEFKRSVSALGGAIVGSGILLGAPASTLGRVPTPTPLSRAPTPVPGPRSGTPTMGGLLAPPGAAAAGGGKDGKDGSIAIRAMRSVRSMARLWDGDEGGKEKEKENDGEGEGKTKKTKVKVKVKAKVKDEGGKDKEKEEKRREKEERKREKELEKREREKEKERKERGKRAPKSSGSSFEVGALGTSPVQRKRSILGLGMGLGKSSIGPGKGTGIGMGLPSALTIGRSASGGKASTASSVFVPHAPPNTISNPSGAPVDPKRLSAESAYAGHNGRRESTNSSLRPLSVLSSTGSSAGSRVSSGSSVRWAEEVVDRVRGKDRGERKEEKEREKLAKKEARESRRSSEGRRRTPLSDVFPGLSRRSSASTSAAEVGPPMLTVEEATTDGHGHGDEDEDVETYGGEYDIVSATPAKRPRPRPVSDEMMLNGGRAVKSRPRGIIEDTAADGVLTLLDAATNDLAQLITHLDLEATPGTPSPGRGPIVPRAEWQESPTGKSKTLRASDGSVSSLRPYAARVGTAAPQAMLGQQIAPWPTASPPPASSKKPSEATFKRMHRRTMTPTPEPDPAPVFHPLRLRPSRIRPPLTVTTSSSSTSPPPSSDDHHAVDMRAPSSLTFGSRSSDASVEDPATLRGLPPVFTRGHARNRSSLLPDAASPKSSQGSTLGMPLARETKRVLGMGGTMGGSDASGLFSRLGGVSPVDDTLSFLPPLPPSAPPPPSPGLPPLAPLPVISPSPPQIELPVLNIQLIDDEAHHGDIDEGALSSEEDTKRSFDFTGELQKLNESGASDRRSFVEQLEAAFQTPAKLDLRGLLCVDVPPPVPSIPVTLKADTSGSSTASSEQTSSGFQVPQSVSRLVDMKEPTIAISSDDDHSMDVDVYSASQIVNLKEPTLLPGSDSLASDDSLAPPPRPFASKPSHGQLDVKFKFGGDLPAEEKQKEKPKPKPSKKPLTLSDIIPPPSHVRSQSLSSLMEEDDSVMKSILAHAADLPHPRVDSDPSMRRMALENSRVSMVSMHSRTRSRPQSGISFTGFDSFDEVRRGFEFHNNRPAFYPPPVASNNRRVPHAKQDSVFSIASVSSYGHVTNPGAPDPFEYGLVMPSLRERPSSEDLSVSMSIHSQEDTFAFLAREPPQRQRVASDASSFYFKAPAQPSARGHRRRESNMSVSSQGGPPISFYNYNRSYGDHRLSENDTSTSGSSLAHQYAAYGATGGRAAYARHRQDSSMDSVMSDFSVARLGRPGLGERMFDTAGGQPLRAISASPPESRSDLRNRSSFDSIIDEERRSSMEDSLFEKTGHRSSMSSDSVFGYDDHHMPNGHLLPPTAFRPLSVLSFNNSTGHSPARENDTMITMLDGGHVRRRSIGSIYEASPCVRVEKRKHIAFQEDEMAPNKARIVNQPSIASTASSKFGEERFIRARQGLLVRQSLEETALVAQGEDLPAFRPAAVFTRPSPNRSRSSTITTSSSSGAETPPLSPGSVSEGSQSSIDMSQVNVILSNSTHPMSSTARDRARARARGHGHRRRYSATQTRASRSSVYETIAEERPSPSTIGSKMSESGSPTAHQGIWIAEPDAGSVDLTASGFGFDDERGIMALRRYYELRNEAEDTVTESRRIWSDTPFSLYALQAFSPPKNPEGMQALLQHSVQSFGHLPPELGPRRTTASPDQHRLSPAELHRTFATNNALQAVEVNSNVDVYMSPAVLSPKRSQIAPNVRPRVASAARRTALGWGPRKTSTKAQKENDTSMTGGVSFMMTPGESLRLSRPRPRGRPTPARAGAPTPRQPITAI
ncbi:hypothetical protein MVEN_02002300 [Mycena venus]|uniref:Uncharacterized protein n=1 Tax=Mycena venus TaxID=2733690 RepID=A0A8H6XF34_9AGAR|nr:hypothetical protein MVEN_02002300 [Mycena venus]